MFKLAPVFSGKLFNEELYLIEEEICAFPMKSSLRFKRRNVDTSVLSSNPTFQSVFSEGLQRELLELYGQTNHMFLHWALKPEAEQNEALKTALHEAGLAQDFEVHDLCGSVCMVTPDELINRKNFEYLSREGEEYFPFDATETLIACFRLVDGQVEDEIYLFNVHNPDKVESMGVGCERYLELAAQAKLFNKWQYAYLDRDSAFHRLLHTVVPLVFGPVDPDLSSFGPAPQS